MEICSLNSSSKTRTCLTKKEIIQLVSIFNDCLNKNSRLCNSIDAKQNIKTLKKTKDQILSELLKKLNLSKEEEIKDLFFYKNNKKLYYNIKYNIYKKQLKNRFNGWLNTDDIDYLMNQYSNKYDFYFYGTFPSDYFLNNEFQPKSYPAGIVFNLDPSYKEGSHWVSMVIDSCHNINYYDSNGVNPNKFLEKFIKNINGKLNIVNKKQIQKKDGLCGIYAMNFIIETLAKKNKKYKANDTLMLTKVKEFYTVNNDFMKNYT